MFAILYSCLLMQNGWDAELSTWNAWNKVSTVFTSLSSKCMCNYDFEHGGHTFSLVLGCLIKWWRDHMYV